MTTTDDEVFHSVQVKMNGIWITEQTRIETFEDAYELAVYFRQNKANKPRVRVNTHTTHSQEI